MNSLHPGGRCHLQADRKQNQGTQIQTEYHWSFRTGRQVLQGICASFLAQKMPFAKMRPHLATSRTCSEICLQSQDTNKSPYIKLKGIKVCSGLCLNNPHVLTVLQVRAKQTNFSLCQWLFRQGRGKQRSWYFCFSYRVWNAILNANAIFLLLLLLF